MARIVSEKELFYDRLGASFATSLSDYDTRRRVEVLVGEFFSPLNLSGRSVLDVGCGLGFFSEALISLGAEVTATDIAPTLVEKVSARLKCRAEVADALELVPQFGLSTFDAVISSECIEHTPNPAEAIRQMCRVLKPGGYFALSTPNLVWYPVVAAASRFGLRPFDGLENFNTFSRIRKVLEQEGLSVLTEKGLHLFPFQLGLHGLSTICDINCQWARHLMINLCVLSVKSAWDGESQVDSTGNSVA